MGKRHFVSVTSWKTLIPTSIMNFLKLILWLSKPVSNMEVEFLSTHSASSNRATCMTIELASVDCPKKWSFSHVGSFVDLDIILTQKVITTSLNNCSNLLTLLVVHLDCRPAVGTPTSKGWAELTHGCISLNFEGTASVFRNNFRFIFSCMRHANFLTETIFMFLNMTYFLPIFPDNIRVRSIQKGAWRRQ